MLLQNPIQDLLEVYEDKGNGLVLEKNVSLFLPDRGLPIRCNVYRPIGSENEKFPVIMTYGPYGKDIPYEHFRLASFKEVNPEHRSKYSAWETPEPTYWTKQGYVVVRIDEPGSGQSPGYLDPVSRDETIKGFFDAIEWAAVQPWSTGKIGLLGISYFAATQWLVASLRPKGLTCIIPWEGTSDIYREHCRHGGISSNVFTRSWWARQLIPNQYGKPGRKAANWGDDTLEGDLSEKALAVNRRDVNMDNAKNQFLDDEFHSSRQFPLEDIEVPLLSVANWGGFSLHLRGNVEGYARAGSKLKYIRFITGRHDLPFYYHDQVEVQKSFLDAFLKGNDTVGWSIPGKVPSVSLVLRKGNVGFNNPEAEAVYKRRDELSWPIARTKYTNFYLHADGSLGDEPDRTEAKRSYKALGMLDNEQLIQFVSRPFEKETEVTGHIVAHLNVSLTPETTEGDKDIDLFITIRHITPEGDEIPYTGTMGEPAPVTKGWLRVSLRKVDEESPRHRPYLPQRNYRSFDVQKVEAEQVYGVDVEVWPTNVVVEKGGRIVLEVSSGDTRGVGVFQHDSEMDRMPAKFAGMNHVHFGEGLDNYVTLPIIPEAE